MSEQPIILETPLHYWRDRVIGQGEAGLLACEAPLMGYLNLRGNPDDEQFLLGVESVVGISLPTTPCATICDEQTRIYWLGPNEWLLRVASGRETDLEERLRRSYSGHLSLVDVSGGHTLINLSGSGVATLLKKSCGYDFHPANFGSGRCVQTTFAKATALVSKTNHGSFELIIRRSFADYIFQWIIDAAAEYGDELRTDL